MGIIYWTVDELQILESSYQTMQIKDLSKLLNRSIHSVYQKANQLGINRTVCFRDEKLITFLNDGVKNKKCKMCLEWKSINDFHYKNKNQNTYRSSCKVCRNKQKRIQRSKKPETL